MRRRHARLTAAHGAARPSWTSRRIPLSSGRTGATVTAMSASQAAHAQLGRFLSSLDSTEQAAFIDQLHDVVCDAFAIAPEPEHLYAHRYADYLTDPTAQEPFAHGIDRVAAYRCRCHIRELALSLQDVFTPPLRMDSAAAICDTVIALARRANQVNVG
jgi:hypothetical protein